jgi:hypothetical protein
MYKKNGFYLHLRMALFIGAAAFLLTAIPVRAQSYLSGTYNCVQAEIGGKKQPCSTPSIEMKSDGSYRMLGESGNYEIVAGRWLILSASKNHGRARLYGSNKIIFEFVSGGKRSKIVYRQKYQRPSGWVSG